MSDRDEFEAAICELAGGGFERPFPRDDDGNYHAELQSMWMVWQAARRWRPIEEAPVKHPERGCYSISDDDYVLVTDGDTVTHAINLARDGWVDSGRGESIHMTPTHWMPLPEPPNE